MHRFLTYPINMIGSNFLVFHNCLSFQNSFSLDQNVENAERKKVVKCSTPSYPSPIDRIQCGKHKRAEALGWTGWRNSSFEGNQSFPRSSRLKLRRDEIDPDTPPPRMTMERIRGR
jgi:hypothetical protein